MYIYDSKVRRTQIDSQTDMQADTQSDKDCAKRSLGGGALELTMYGAMLCRRGELSMAKATLPAVSAVCDYCAEVWGPVYGLGCQREDGQARRRCIHSLLQDLQEIRARLDD